MSEGFLRHLFFVLISLFFFIKKLCRSFYLVSAIPFLMLFFQSVDQSYHPRRANLILTTRCRRGSWTKKQKYVFFIKKKLWFYLFYATV